MDRLNDKDLFQLGTHTGSPVFAEFLCHDGRVGWRLYNRLGYGILLTREDMEYWHKLLSESLDDFYLDKSESE